VAYFFSRAVEDFCVCKIVVVVVVVVGESVKLVKT